MCQLSAIIPKRELTAEEQSIQRWLMSSLLAENSTMNRDGTGIANFKHLYKVPEKGADVVITPEFYDALTEMVSCGLPIIGHVRATSTGRNAKEGPHPFSAGHIVMAHNGTFSKYKELEAYKTFEKDDDPVDSHVVTRELATRLGDKPLNLETLKAVVEDVDGSYALLILDKLDEKLWVVRGSCSLYRADVGPFIAINTQRGNLEECCIQLQRFLWYYTGDFPEVGKLELLDSRTAYVYQEGELAKVGELPFVKKKVAVQRTCGTSGYVGSNKGSFGNRVFLPSTVARQMVDLLADAIDQCEGLETIEARTAIRYVTGKEWYELSVDELAAMSNALVNLHHKYFTPAKRRYWDYLQSALITMKKYRYPYTVLDEREYTVHCPFFINTEEELNAMVQDLWGEIYDEQETVPAEKPQLEGPVS